MCTDEEIFQKARRHVIALIQKIAFEDFLPKVIGRSLPTYTGFNDSEDTTIAVAFATTAFRYGHCIVNQEVLLYVMYI